MERLFRGGSIVSSEGVKTLDLLVRDEKIAAVGEHLCTDGEIVDVSGKYLFPGFIDAHTHMDLEVAGTVTADGFDTGTKAELSGGTTCIVDFATQNRGETLAYALEQWHKKADHQSHCDYAFHLAISDWNEEISRELAQITAQGIRSFKLYMTYDAMVLDDRSIYEVLARLKELGGIAGVHCENRGIIDACLAQVKKAGGHTEVSNYPGTRPAYAEAEAISRLLKIAKCVDTPVIIVHLSSKEGYEEIRRARAAGQTVYVETCPQYLLLGEEKYLSGGNEARKYMIAPPLRTKSDQETLWRALENNELQTICTDHCSFSTAQKMMGAEDFAKTPCGMPGGEERPGLIYHYGVGGKRLTLSQMCAYLSENVAKLYQLYPQKGALLPGSDADIVVWNPQTQWTLSKETQKANTDYCPMEGTKLCGRAEQVYLRGQLAAENGEIVREYLGKYVSAAKQK